jgi:hypothetical protein
MYFTNARKWQEKSMAPIVDLTLLCESDFWFFRLQEREWCTNSILDNQS